MCERPRPTWEPLRLRCDNCAHQWDDWQPSGVPLDFWVAWCRALTCPRCRAGRVLMRLTPLPTEQP